MENVLPWISFRSPYVHCFSDIAIPVNVQGRLTAASLAPQAPGGIVKGVAENALYTFTGIGVSEKRWTWGERNPCSERAYSLPAPIQVDAFWNWGVHGAALSASWFFYVVNSYILNFATFDCFLFELLPIPFSMKWCFVLTRIFISLYCSGFWIPPCFKTL